MIFHIADRDRWLAAQAEGIPAEGYGEARATYSYQPGVMVGYDDFTGITAGTALNARTAPTGGSWATSGSATDWIAADAPAAGDETVSRAEMTHTTPRFGVLGSTNYTDTEVAVRTRPVYPSGVEAVIEMGPLARWVDSSNHLRFIRRGNVYEVVRVIAGASVILGTGEVGKAVDGWRRLRLVVFASGRGVASVFNADETLALTIKFTDAQLATGGTLASGKPGIHDRVDTYTGTVTRYYDNFYIATPPAEPIALYSGRTIRFGASSTKRYDASGVYLGDPPSYVGTRVKLAPDGGVGRKNRFAVMAKRNDTTVAADDHIADAITLSVTYTPLYLNAPR